MNDLYAHKTAFGPQAKGCPHQEASRFALVPAARDASSNETPRAVAIAHILCTIAKRNTATQQGMPGFIKVMLASSFRVEKFCSEKEVDYIRNSEVVTGWMPAEISPAGCLESYDFRNT
jgi:hypothetical protein